MEENNRFNQNKMATFTKDKGYGSALLHAIASAVPTFGNIFVVFNSSDTDESNYNIAQQVFTASADGKTRFFTDFASAYAATESNNNDVIILDGNSTHTLTSMLTVSNSRVHFFGLDALLGNNRAYGQSSKVSLTATTGATNIATILNTGVRNSFHGIKFMNASTVAEGIYCFVDGGEYTYMENCEVYKSTDLDVTASAEFVCNADSPNYVNCTFGSLADARSGAVVRANVLFTKEIAGAGLVTRDATFKDCNFWIQCTNSAQRFVYGANATDIERVALFDNCNFICNGASTAIPAQNIAFGATLTVGAVLVKNCSSVLASTAVSTTTGVYVDGPVPTAGTTGISVQAS